MDLSQDIIEAAVMAATTGQFGTQVVYETFKLNVDALTAAKKELFLHICSGIVALTAYVITQPSFAPKAALLTFLSGIFAEAVLKLLKKKNEASKDKTDSLAQKIHELDLADKDLRIKELEDKLKSMEAK
jgi:hypothetical protein